ncbi:hypothetical protein D3C71_1683030 [compost metagenome]
MPTGLLIRHDQQRQIAFQRNSELGQQRYREQQPGKPALHVGGSTAQHVSVPDLSAERIEIPAVEVACGHDIRMTAVDQLLPGRVFRSLESRDQIQHFRGSCMNLRPDPSLRQIIDDEGTDIP